MNNTHEELVKRAIEWMECHHPDSPHSTDLEGEACDIICDLLTRNAELVKENRTLSDELAAAEEENHALEEIEVRCLKAEAENKGLKEAAEWKPIPFDDEDAEKRGIEFPPSDTPILMGMMQSSIYPNPEWVYDAGLYHSTKGGWIASSYTHWMPLPTPPKEQTR